MAHDFLREHRELLPERPTYLDIACSYGWFVRAFGELGFEAYGVEIDWAAIEIGRLVYGLKPAQITRSEAVQFLQGNPGSYDVVSCFSLLHHFILNRASVSAVEMLKLIDRATKTILFLDMGQEHEEWFRESLAGWNADRIEEWLRENSTFTKIYRLGVDRDNVPPFADNYGRTLFACLR
jgi:SAM-dependent methyltransferase